MAAAHHVLIQLPQAGCDRAHVTRADWAMIDAGHGGDLGSGAGHESHRR